MYLEHVSLVSIPSEDFNAAKGTEVTLVVEAVHPEMVGGLEVFQAEVALHLHAERAVVERNVVLEALLGGGDDTALRTAGVLFAGGPPPCASASLLDR